MEDIRHNVKLDSLGRVCVPKSFLRSLGWEENSLVTLELDSGKVIVSKKNLSHMCHECGTEVRVTDHYCFNCGVKLHED